MFAYIYFSDKIYSGHLISKFTSGILQVFIGYLCCKTITSQNVLSEAQFKNILIS